MRMQSLIALLAGSALSASALAQPTSTDLGTLTPGVPIATTGTIAAAGEVHWFTFTLASPVNMSSLTFLNVDTILAGFDTEIAVFSNSGTLIATDDDDADGLHSSLTFGSGDATFAGTGGLVTNGRDQSLAAGTYYLAVVGFNTTFSATNWGITTAGTAVGGYNLNLLQGTATAQADPAGTIDLGTMTQPQTITRNTESLTAGQIQWYKVVIPEVGAGVPNFLDIDTAGTALSPTNDTTLAIYLATGAVAGGTAATALTDTIDSTDSLAAFSFGMATPTRPAAGNGVVFNGRDGRLQAGTYYIAVGAPGTTPTAASTASGVNFGYTSTSTNEGPIALSIVLNASDIPPSGTGSASGCVTSTLGGTMQVRVTVTPGNPPAGGLGVTVDASALGLGTLTLLDNGLDDDGVAGNNIFGLNPVVASGNAAQAYSLPFTVSDNFPRSSGGTIAFTIVNDDYSGELPASATDASGQTQIIGTLSANKSAMYRIDICDPATFSATTANGVGGIADTQLFLFDANGMGLAVNDDHVTPTTGLRSTITNQFVTSPGTYYIAVAQYNRDPSSGTACSNSLIFVNTPFRSERTADGPGAANPVVLWTGTTAGGDFQLDLTGVTCGCTVTCDFNQDGGGDTSDIIDLADAIAAGTDPFPASCKDFNQDGGADTSDVIEMADAVASGTCP